MPPGAKHQTFAINLDTAMKRLGMSSSDLAREMWGSSVDKRGVSSAKNRDSIRFYLEGSRLPTPENLRRMAHVLATTAEDLTGYPDRPEQSKTEPRPQHIAAASDHDELTTTLLPLEGKIRLKINKVLDWELALKIQKMVLEAEHGTTGVNPDNGKIVGGTDTEATGIK